MSTATMVMDDDSSMVGSDSRRTSFCMSSLQAPRPAALPTHETYSRRPASPLPPLTDTPAEILETCAAPMGNTAAPMRHVAPPKGCLPIVEWAPKDASERKYYRDVT